MYPTIIQRNFFSKPDKIVELSNFIKWNKSSDGDNWPGYRSDNIFNIDRQLHDGIVEEVLKLYFGHTKFKIGFTLIQFSKINYDDWLVHEKKSSRIHKDPYELAGMIYLNKDKNDSLTGTSVYDENKNPVVRVSNCYNTLACYDGNMYHGATSIDEKDRLTIVMFFKNIRKLDNAD